MRLETAEKLQEMHRRHLGTQMRDAGREISISMDALDRRIVALRHFEELSNGEMAEVLGVTPQVASNCYIRPL